MSKAVRSTDTFAQLNKISITYGNNTKLMDEFDEHYLYQTALNNGLKDTTYADTGVLNSDMAIDENRPLGRRDKWTKEAYEELEEVGRRNRALFRKLDNEDYDQYEIDYPYRKGLI